MLVSRVRVTEPVIAEPTGYRLVPQPSLTARGELPHFR